jgi:hypothetical protein
MGSNRHVRTRSQQTLLRVKKALTMNQLASRTDEYVLATPPDLVGLFANFRSQTRLQPAVQASSIGLAAGEASG